MVDVCERWIRCKHISCKPSCHLSPRSLLTLPFKTPPHTLSSFFRSALVPLYTATTELSRRACVDKDESLFVRVSIDWVLVSGERIDA